MNNKPDEEQTLAPPFFFVLDLSSDTPIYQQIRDQIVVAIADGHLSDGTALPTTRQLALDFGINIHTVNKAYDVLRQEGFVSLTRKQGSFIRRTLEENPTSIKDWQARLRTLLAEAVARGLTSEQILQDCQTILNTFPQPAINPDGK